MLLKNENLRALTKLVLIFSTIGFFFLLVMFISDNPLLYIGSGNVGAYSAVVLGIVLLFPLSLGLTLSARRSANRPVIMFLVAFLVMAVLVFVPAIAVQRPYPVHCLGTYSEWQSIGYHLFGIGSHFDLSGCA